MPSTCQRAPGAFRLPSSPTAASRRSLSAGSVLIAACLLAWAAPARADYQCRDAWGNGYRLPTPPATDGTGIVCDPEPLPEPAGASPTGAGAAASMWRLDLIDVKPLRAKPAAAAPMSAADLQAFGPLIDAAASRYGHDANLLKAIVQVESGFNPKAVSPKGAVGLMQVMPATARGLGVDGPSGALFDPARNLDTGARYLRQLMDRFVNRPDLAIAAYNAGETAVMRHGYGIPPYPETQAYVKNVLGRYEQMRAARAVVGAVARKVP